jgi:ribosomal protein L7/L12
MSLIRCPECSTEVSNQAISCPKCGYPMQKQPKPGQEDPGRVLQVLREEGKIAAIKLYREIHEGIGLAEAKQAIDRLEAAEIAAGRMKRPAAGCMPMLVIAAGLVGSLVWIVRYFNAA